MTASLYFGRCVVLATSVGLLCACSKGEKKRVDKSGGGDGTAQTQPVEVQPPPGPKGVVAGSVAFTGSVEMPLLQRGSDPICAKTEKRAETILVNSNQTLRNVVVRVKPKTVPAWRPAKTIRVDQLECMYQPRVQAAVAGQRLVIGNGDQTAHNVHLRTVEMGKRQGIETLWNRQQPKNMKPIESTVDDVPVIKLKCDQHGWMSGYIVVSDNGYYTVTGDTGSFELEVPTGEITIQAWHEFYGLKEKTVTVAEGARVDLAFAFDHDRDNPTGGN